MLTPPFMAQRVANDITNERIASAELYRQAREARGSRAIAAPALARWAGRRLIAAGCRLCHFDPTLIVPAR